MRSLRRDFITYGCVVAGGLLIGFSVPRPGWARWEGPSRPPTTAEPPEPVATADSDVLGMPGLEPMPAAMDGAESPELRALRKAEKQLFGDAAPSKVHASLPPPVEPDVCEDGTMCRDEGPSSEWMTGLRMPDLPVHSDVKVARFLQYFTTNAQGRKMFRAWLKRSGRYRATDVPISHNITYPEPRDAGLPNA